MTNWFTLIKKLMQTSIVIVSGSIINASTVHLNHMTLYIETCIRQTPCIKRTLQHSPRVSTLYRFHCMLFQLVLTRFFKSELFLYLLKVDHVITVLQRDYSYKVSHPIFLNLLVFNTFVGMIQKRIHGHLLPV